MSFPGFLKFYSQGLVSDLLLDHSSVLSALAHDRVNWGDGVGSIKAIISIGKLFALKLFDRVDWKLRAFSFRKQRSVQHCLATYIFMSLISWAYREFVSYLTKNSVMLILKLHLK